jgi:hypothetical protein
MEIQGRIKLIRDAQVISDKFQKREFVITTDGQYPEHIQCEFVQDKCSLLDSFNVNQMVTVSINLKGREWTDKTGQVKYFNTIQAWKISAVGGQAVNSAVSDAVGASMDSDLPF